MLTQVFTVRRNGRFVLLSKNMILGEILRVAVDIVLLDRNPNQNLWKSKLLSCWSRVSEERCQYLEYEYEKKHKTKPPHGWKPKPFEQENVIIQFISEILRILNDNLTNSREEPLPELEDRISREKWQINCLRDLKSLAKRSGYSGKMSFKLKL